MNRSDLFRALEVPVQQLQHTAQSLRAARSERCDHTRFGDNSLPTADSSRAPRRGRPRIGCHVPNRVLQRNLRDLRRVSERLPNFLQFLLKFLILRCSH